MAWFDKFFSNLSKKIVQFEAKQICLIFIISNYFTIKNDFWSYKFPERLNGWIAIQNVPRAWFRSPSLSISF